MAQNKQARKWQLTFNNPIEKSYTHDKIKEELKKLKSLVYWCMADEVGKTHHTHIYVAFNNAVRFSTLKNSFNGAHFEIAHGTSEQNRDYIAKTGKWENDKKHGTNIVGTFEEYGEIPLERQGARNDLADLYDMIKAGATNFEIMEENPEHMLHLDRIERARQTVKAEEYKNTFRNMEVTYIWGETNTGKTRYVMENYGYHNVYRITDYRNPFDSYSSQNIILFEEFHSQIKIQQMLTLLDGYPLELPCRYANRQACYTKVYIASNIELYQQYLYEKENEPAIWAAFLRRINKIIKFPQIEHEECIVQLSMNDENDLPF